MSIYLIRHGKTEANEKRLYCGSTDLPLSEAGREELQSLTYAITPERFVTSGMKRANETLEILFGNVPFSVDSRFREMDFGLGQQMELSRDLFPTWMNFLEGFKVLKHQ